ncbi:Dual specificity mitogen-activated protein kinase kinase 6 [Trichinella pseudospiralis]|uniref:mitogen-activated protein kinase kinase n=1 Tax=Trichinella pseudospiralis TaxID=6337 RepID=A0A0V1KEM2_TRIPS|nr:Dual specificity mitogen-activated protein kinase kinase 6 [Trichinella pseudospiralis]
MSRQMLPKLSASNSLLLICDMQERFRNTIKYFPAILQVAQRLLEGSKLLGLPVVATEQYPKGLHILFHSKLFATALSSIQLLLGLGRTVAELDLAKYNVPVFEKTCFSMLQCDKVASHIQSQFSDRKTVILCGIEAHVCIYQTTIDLLEKNFNVHLVVDAISSRNQVDRQLERLGAFLTTNECVLLGLVQDAGKPQFREVQKLIMNLTPDSGFQISNENKNNYEYDLHFKLYVKFFITLIKKYSAIKSKRKVNVAKIAVSNAPSLVPKPPANLEDHFSVKINDTLYDIRAEDLIRIKELGRGSYGIVETMLHSASNTVFAVKFIFVKLKEVAEKRIHLTVNDEEQKRMLIELNTSMKSGSCPHMVQFYGAMFREGDVWLCMEAMDLSLDKFYRMCVDQKRIIPDFVLSKIAHSIVEALHYMKQELNLMHRDVKPSNVLLNRKGEIKICDFGISGHLTDSLAKTINAGCKPYMAPERINPHDEAQHAYDIRSDVWSLGITMIEVATGNHPYSKWKTPFEQLKQVVMDSPPKLPNRNFSEEFESFKNFKERPKYKNLLEHSFLKRFENCENDVAAFINEVLNDANCGAVSEIASTLHKLSVSES